MADLYLAVDTGGSSTKIIYQSPTSRTPAYLLMPPEVEKISKDRWQHYIEKKSWVGNPTPQQQAWLSINDEIWVVGAIASEFDPEDRLRERKYENALYKVLAAIGVLVETLKLSTKQKLTVTLGVLLPWNEYNDQKAFRTQLEIFLSDYQFRGQRLRVKLESYLCRPEGSGLFLARTRTLGNDWLRSHKVGVLMLGHRNVSALYFEEGQFREGESPLYGFAEFLDQIIKMTSGLNRASLLTAIFKGVQDIHKEPSFHECRRVIIVSPTQHPDWQSVKAIHTLATAKRPNLREREIQQIVQAIEQTTVDYWERISRWLDRVLPPELDEVIISGGAARFWEPELETYFNCAIEYSLKDSSYKYDKKYVAISKDRSFTKMIWDADLQETIKKALSLHSRSDCALESRLADAFGLFDCLIAKEAQT